MRFPNFAFRGSATFNMTPMIDVVFLLIIFFLVSSHLAKQEAQMELPLPVAESGEQPPDAASRRLTINVLQDGSTLLAGRAVRVGREEPGGVPRPLLEIRRLPPVSHHDGIPGDNRHKETDMWRGQRYPLAPGVSTQPSHGGDFIGCEPK